MRPASLALFGALFAASSATHTETSCPANRVLPALERAFEQRHIVLIGDSVMRYQYLSLAFSLATGSLPAFEFHSVEWKKPRAGEAAVGRPWDAFLNATSHLLHVPGRNASEYCDCSRPGGQRTPGVENRYFSTGANTHISLFNWVEPGQQGRVYGNWRPMQGDEWPRGFGVHYNMTAQNASCPARRRVPPDARRRDSPTACSWEYGIDATGQFLAEHVMAMQPRPSLIVLNRGLWGRLELETQFERLLDAGRRLQREHPGVRFMWRTTPITFGHSSIAGFPVLSQQQQALRAKLEISAAHEFGWLTSDLHNLSVSFHRSDTHDGIHFTEAKTACLNLELAQAVLNAGV